LTFVELIHDAKKQQILQTCKGFSLIRRGFSLFVDFLTENDSEEDHVLVLVETPGLAVLADYQLVGSERFDLYTDVIEGLEGIRILNKDSVGYISLDGVALNEKTVSYMLEVSKYLVVWQTANPCDRARKTDIFRI
jgi:hypothetical protein